MILHVIQSICVFFFFIALVNATALTETITDGNLVQLITAEDNVIVFFSKDNCPVCDDLEVIVENIKNELKERIGAVVVKAHNSHMVSLYNPSKEPALVYFRRGLPLLYSGDMNEENIVQMFSENQEPIAKELSDDNFEHLTQAATGATSGDWFVFFYSADCVTCLRLHAVWEAVGAHLKHRVNVARVDRLGAGVFTAKRFNIAQSLEFIFLRQGKVYRYRFKEYTPEKFIEFAESGYQKQTQPESVSPEATFISDYFTKHLEWLAKNQQSILIALVLAFIIALAVIRRWSRRISSEANTNKKAK